MPDPAPYQVLARKYRPAAFDQVVGQEGVVSTLKNAIEKERLHHAYLLSGTRGVGKTTLARLFARALNCAKGPTIEPCGKCDPCREIVAGSSMDVIEIDGASNRKVEDVDPLREAARYAPARDRHKIFIIDEVHMLSETAFNALLKTLEEPPPRTIFLFATTEPEEVPDTIMSRCLHLACRRVPRREIAVALAATARAEKVKGTDEAFDLIAGLAEGSMRDGLSLLDQAIAFGGGDLPAETVRQALGLIDRGIVKEFIESIGRQDAPAALSAIERLSEAGADLSHFSRDALARVRDLLVVRTAGAARAGSLGVGADEAAEAETLAGLFTPDGLLRLTQAMLDLADRIRRAEHPRYLLEASALRMVKLVDLTPIEDLIRATGDAGRGGSGGSGAGGARRGRSGPPGADPSGLPFDASSRPAVPAPEEPSSAPSAPGLAEGGGSVPRILERISARRLSLGTFLGQANGIRIEGDSLVIPVAARQAFLKAALESEDNVRIIVEETAAALGSPLAVKVVQEAPATDDLSALAQRGGDSGGNGRDRLIEEALKEPAVKAVMDKFKGRIVDIREAR